jgi:hypothetical protein
MGLVCLLTCASCAAKVPYRYGYFPSDLSADEPVELGGPPVEFGKPIKALDRVASVVGLPEKIMGLNQKISNHEVSLDTVVKLRRYLVQNDLDDVAIYVNCYDPKEQWRRLRENRRVGAGWRYSLGTLSIVGYTLLPGRVFGGDTYNPYTNTLNIDSDVPAIAILEAALAKKIHSQRLPGTYATVTDLPGLALVRRCRAVGDVLGYARAQHDWEIERQAYHVLYAQVGAETATMAGLMSPAWWAMPALGVGGAAAGHVTGRMMAAQRAAEIEAAEIEPAATGTDKVAADLDTKTGSPSSTSSHMAADPLGNVLPASFADSP